MTQSYEEPRRYTGWLDRDRASVRVRTDIQALGAAIESHGDPWPPLRMFDLDIAKLHAADLRALLRGAAAQTRRHARGRGVTMTDRRGRLGAFSFISEDRAVMHGR